MQGPMSSLQRFAARQMDLRCEAIVLTSPVSERSIDTSFRKYVRLITRQQVVRSCQHMDGLEECCSRGMEQW
jgi:hypothetical protein